MNILCNPDPKLHRVIRDLGPNPDSESVRPPRPTRPCPRPARETAESLAGATTAARVVYMATGDDPSVEPTPEVEANDDPMVDPTAEQDVTDAAAERDIAVGEEEGGV